MDNIFEDIINKYKLEPNTYEADLIGSNEESTVWLEQFREKWQARFVSGYWNLEISGLPQRWLDAIDEALDLIEIESPEFKIAQIKIKFGGIRINLFDISSQVFYSLQELERVLYDDRFYY